MKSRSLSPLPTRRGRLGMVATLSRLNPLWLVAFLLIIAGSMGLRISSASAVDTGSGGISLTTLGSAYTQDFNSLATSGTTNTSLPTGWFLTEQGGGARDNEAYGADNGGSNTGDIYSYGTTSSGERAFGALRSGTLVPFIGASFTNNTGSVITDLIVSYTGEQWRLGTAGRFDRIDFQISTNATDLTTGTYTDVNSLDFSSPFTTIVGALDGNAAANRTAIGATITGLNIANGATFFIRWLDFDASGADDGLAVDDFSMTPVNNPSPTDPTGVGSANPGTVAPGGSTLLTVTVTPGANPTSTGIMVTGNLSSIGGSAAQLFFDDGMNGDVAAGDNTFSFQATVSISTSLGAKTLPIAITDAQARTGGTTILLNVQVAPLVVISQVYGGGGNSGATLRNDFIELFNRGNTTVSLAGWSVQYNTATGSGTWLVTNLSGSIPPGGYYLVQEAQGAGGTTNLPTPDAVGTIAMGAGAGKVALVNTTVALSGGCPSSANISDLIGYGGANCFEGGGAAPALSNTTAGLRARQGCRDTNNNSVDFSSAAPNPRNSASPLYDCSAPPPFFAINAIQGSGASSPLAGQEVTTTGIVTARKSNGFFLQMPDANVDADPNTSEGIFIFTSIAPAPALGDAVSVVGTAGEFFGLTQLASSNLDVISISSGNPLPAPVNLVPSILNPAGTIGQLERLEGMRLRADALISIAPTNEFGEIFTVLSGVARSLREPGIEISKALPPGAPCCVPRFDENPERLMIDSDGRIGAAALVVTTGVTLTNVTGPLDFTFGDYKLLPDAPPAVSANLSAIPVPAPNSNEFTVGSFNLENFFTTNSNFADRLNKASLAIRNVMRSPDIIGVEEVGDIAALTALADKINNDSGAPNPNYQAILIESDDDTENDIDVGFLVKTSRVNVVSVMQEGRNATYINPLNNEAELLNDRPPLILRATVQAPVGPAFPVTVIVNHLRSLIDVDQDPGDGPRVRAKRRAQAEFLANLIQSLQSENLVLVGDFNAFQFNDGYVDVIGTVKGAPIPVDQVVLAGNDLVNPNLNLLVDTLPPDQRYSFVFLGNAQTLDHVLVDGEMLQRSTRFAYARNNADFPDSFGSDATRSERVSDHDMPVAYFDFPPVNLTFYLHGTGPDNNPPTLFLDQTAPTAATAKFRDSAAINFNGGNPWKNVGAWPRVQAAGTMTALSDLHVWLGLKNSDDQGTRFDLRAEVYKNGALVAAGETYCIQGVTRNPNLAKEVTLSLASFSPVTFNGDGLSLKVLTRIGTNGAGGFCGGHSNAVGLRLYFDASSRPSRFGATF